MTQTGRIAVALLALVFVPLALAKQGQQDEKVDLKTVDSLLFNTLRDVINRGADMYNNGDHAGCYRLFEGALITARPLLAHRPEIQKTITNALGAASRDPVTYRRAFALRAALDKTRTELNPNFRKEDKKPDPDVKKEDKKPVPDPDVKKEDKKPDEKKDDEKKDDKEKLKDPKKEPDDTAL